MRLVEASGFNFLTTTCPNHSEGFANFFISNTKTCGFHESQLSGPVRTDRCRHCYGFLSPIYDSEESE